MVLGAIALVDLRPLGPASTKRPFAEFSRQVLPFTWVASVIAVIADFAPVHRQGVRVFYSDVPARGSMLYRTFIFERSLRGGSP
jgi:hypothetical protein